MSEMIWVTWATKECGKCGCKFQVTDTFDKDKQENKTTFYCPNGHPRAYVESEADRLRRERDRLKQNEARLNEEIAAERRRADAAERKAAKARKRTEAGLCPCCNRTFRQLALHMKSKHANVVKLDKAG